MNYNNSQDSYGKVSPSKYSESANFKGTTDPIENNKNENIEYSSERKVWDRLFILAHERTKAREEYVKKYNEKMKEKEYEQYSFKPEIDENSRKIATGTKTAKVEERYKTYKHNLAVKEKQAQRAKELKEIGRASCRERVSAPV